jgi:flagellar basal-body rod modification protein FlgD
MANIPGLRTYDPSGANAPSVDGTNVQSSNDLSKNFLRMLTVQLQNQDPLNPMDNAAMTAQLAQLNMVDGINKLNTSVGAMMAQLKAATSLSMADSVGRSVLSEGSSLYNMGQPMSMAAELQANADSLMAVLRDSQGQEVDRLDLGAAKSGVTDFIWDARNEQGQALPDGVYRLELLAKDAQGEELAVKSYVSAMVSSIGYQDGLMKLGLHDGRSISADDIFKWVAV